MRSDDMFDNPRLVLLRIDVLYVYNNGNNDLRHGHAPLDVVRDRDKFITENKTTIIRVGDSINRTIQRIDCAWHRNSTYLAIIADY